MNLPRSKFSSASFPPTNPADRPERPPVEGEHGEHGVARPLRAARRRRDQRPEEAVRRLDVRSPPLLRAEG